MFNSIFQASADLYYFSDLMRGTGRSHHGSTVCSWRWVLNKYLMRNLGPFICSDVIMNPITSQISGTSGVYSIVCSLEDQRKHQSVASLAFVRGIYRWPVNSPHKARVWIEDALTAVNASFQDGRLLCWWIHLSPVCSASLFKLFWWYGYLMLKNQYHFSVKMSKLHHLKLWKKLTNKFEHEMHWYSFCLQNQRHWHVKQDALTHPLQMTE